MTFITPIRIATALGTVALLAGALATTAGAVRDGRSPDTQDAASQTGTIDPAIAVAMASHQTSVAAADKRSPDTVGAAAAQTLDPAIAVATADKRSPDTRDATGGIAAPTATPHHLVVDGDSVFDWTDAGIGAAAGFAIALLLGGMILLSHRGRHGSLAV